MEPIEQKELEDEMVKAAIPSIKKFVADHSEETFFGFAVELLAEEGYFHLGAGSVESFQPVAQRYVDSGICSEAEVQGDIRWNNQEWPYFDFNNQCPLWSAEWGDMELRIRRYQQYCFQLEESDKSWEEFMSRFRLAGEGALQRILESGVLAGLKRSSDFRAWVFEHHDVF